VKLKCQRSRGDFQLKVQWGRKSEAGCSVSEIFFKISCSVLKLFSLVEFSGTASKLFELDVKILADVMPVAVSCFPAYSSLRQ